VHSCSIAESRGALLVDCDVEQKWHSLNFEQQQLRNHDRASSTNLCLIHVEMQAKVLVRSIGCLYPSSRCFSQHALAMAKFSHNEHAHLAFVKEAQGCSRHILMAPYHDCSVKVVMHLRCSSRVGTGANRVMPTLPLFATPASFMGFGVH